MSYDTTEGELMDLFSGAGSVTDAALMIDRDTGRSRGFAFVTMSSDDEAQEAIRRFNGFELGGRELTVNEARTKESGGGGGGGRRFGGGGGGGGRGGDRGDRGGRRY